MNPEARRGAVSARRSHRTPDLPGAAGPQVTHDLPAQRAPIPALWVINGDPALSDAAVRLWVWYRRHHVGDLGAYVSDPQTARALRWSERKVQRVRGKLHATGYLAIIHRGPNPPGYYPILPGAASPPVATLASPSVTTLVSPFVARVTALDLASDSRDRREDSPQDSPQDSPFLAPVYKDEPVEPGEPEKQKQQPDARGAREDDASARHDAPERPKAKGVSGRRIGRPEDRPVAIGEELERLRLRFEGAPAASAPDASQQPAEGARVLTATDATDYVSPEPPTRETLEERLARLERDATTHPVAWVRASARLALRKALERQGAA